MSTTDTAVADTKGSEYSPEERATALGPGLLRLGDATYLRPFKSDIQVRCLGPLAHWTISSEFSASEPTDGDGRLLFLFPLPSEAALQEFSVGDECLFPGPLTVKASSELSEDSELPTPPDELLAEFGAESLPVLTFQLDRWKDHIQEDTLQILLSFTQGLPTVDGRIHLRCPIAVSESLQAAGQTDVELTIVLEDGGELVDDPEFNLEFETSKEDESLVLAARIDASETIAEDAVLSFRPGRTQMPVTRLRRSEEHFIFSIFPPTSIPASPQRRDIVFALDASENFDPGDFAKVRDDLCYSLRKLDDNDRFALVTFGREINGYDGGEFCDIDKMEEACEWLAQARPQGRADVQPLLQRIQSLPSQEDRQLCVFLLAAGPVGNEPAILKSLDFDQSDRRYYTLGIGSTVKQSFLRRLALLTRGRSEVASRDGCSEALERLLGQTRALLAEVTFDEQDGELELDEESLVPSRMTSLTPQGPVHCLGLGSPASLKFRSKDETGVFFAGTVNAQATESPALAGVWAGLRVRELLDSVNLTTGAKRMSLQSQACILAAEYGILTEDTLLVLETDDGMEIQYSVQPSQWGRSELRVKKGNVNNKESSAPFDWRKGLVAREGLFKGSKAPAGGESGETSGRYGLRSKGLKNSDMAAKPRLDRTVLVSSSPVEETPESAETEVQPTEFEEQEMEMARSAEMEETREPSEETEAVLDPEVSTSSEEEVEESGELSEDSLEEEATDGLALQEGSDSESHESLEPEPSHTPEPSLSLSEPGSVAVPVTVPSVQPPVVSLRANPLSEGRTRLAAYHSQMESFDTELSLAALQGLPEDLSPRGGELPRILAQTVAHLEKRGFFSHAVAVLGLLLKDNSTPEVVKKMESLLGAWADSLPQDKLPEAIQILQLGQRVCQGSQELSTKCQECFARWSKLSSEQAELPVVSIFNSAESTANLSELLSQPQLELAKLQQEQVTLIEQMNELKRHTQEQLLALPETLKLAELKSSVEQQLASLPGMLQKVIEQATAGLALQPAVAGSSPTPETSTKEKEQPPLDAIEQEEAPVSVSVEAEELESPEPVVAEESLETVDASVTQEAPIPEIPLPEISDQVSVEPDPPPTSSEEIEEESSLESSGEMILTKDELTEMLLADPRSKDSHRAVEASLKEAKDRINFFRELVKADKSEPYHSLSLARAYRESEQTKVAVVHYQKYLRSEKDPIAYGELAEAYEELGKAPLAASARKAAEAYKSA